MAQHEEVRTFTAVLARDDTMIVTAHPFGTTRGCRLMDDAGFAGADRCVRPLSPNATIRDENGVFYTDGFVFLGPGRHAGLHLKWGGAAGYDTTGAINRAATRTLPLCRYGLWLDAWSLSLRRGQSTQATIRAEMIDPVVPRARSPRVSV